MVRRFLAASILLLLVLQGIPAARAQQQPQPPPATPTTYETGFSDNRLSVPTFPFSTLSSQNGIPTFSGLGAGPIAVDSREVVHTVGT
ncbi:MAG TPA: hypothetical protein VMU54_12890, partial [Planctomycetota bacterium]|nr:hypothetical protein [Planctomycetota bacterium]